MFSEIGFNKEARETSARKEEEARAERAHARWMELTEEQRTAELKFAYERRGIEVGAIGRDILAHATKFPPDDL